MQLPPNPKRDRTRVCFSFAAYAKNVIDHLKSCKVPVIEGLSDSEFGSLESEFGFEFPPDLRAILREGLPVGTGFPNWRTGSSQQLQILFNLPISGLCHEVSKGNLWCRSWGPRQKNSAEGLELANQFLKKSPVLVPIYRYCYIPCRPNLAGNPVFYVCGGDFRYSGYDVAGFFQEAAFRPDADGEVGMIAPAWAAKAARRIEFWSDLVEGRETACEGKAATGGGWWEVTCGEGGATCCKGKWIEKWFEEMRWTLREGGWKEEDVREMMEGTGGFHARADLRDRESVLWHVRLLSLALRRSGWSKEDVVYSLGSTDVGSIPSGGGSPVHTS